KSSNRLLGLHVLLNTHSTVNSGLGQRHWSSAISKGECMGIFAWIVLGLIAGAIAKLLMPGRDPGGWIVTMLLGIAGAFVGGFIGRAIWGSTGVNGVNMGSIGLAVLGAVV